MYENKRQSFSHDRLRYRIYLCGILYKANFTLNKRKLQEKIVPIKIDF